MKVTDRRMVLGLSDLHSRAQTALSFTLKHLETVTLVYLLRMTSRRMHHSFQQHIIENHIKTSEIERFNRAYPLWSSNANYAVPKPDFRPAISHYLEFVDLGTDPRRLIRAWRVFEETYRVPPTPSHKMRVWLSDAAVEESLEIATIDQARRMRLREEWYWEH